MFEKLVARSYEAAGRKDLDAMMASWSDDAVWEYPGHSAMSGVFVGKAAITDWWRRWLDRMASVRFTVKHAALSNPIALTWSNTMLVEWEADITTTDGLSGHPCGVTAFEFRHGKCVHARDYFLDTALIDKVWGPKTPKATA